MTIETYRRIERKSDREKTDDFLRACLRDLKEGGAIMVFEEGVSRATHPLVREGFGLIGLPVADNAGQQVEAVIGVARDYLEKNGRVDVLVVESDQAKVAGSKLVKFVEIKDEV